MGFFDQLFAGGDEFEEMLERGAMVVDVRTKQEYEMGHVSGSINVPLDALPHKVKKLRNMKRPLVLCCASGARSGQATSMLRNHGIECCNGGSWTRVNRSA